MGVDVLFRF